MPAGKINRGFAHKRLIALSAASRAFPPLRLSYPQTQILQHSCLLLRAFSRSVPAQRGRSAAQKAWLLANSATADQTTSVCTGAAVLAVYGVSGTRFVEKGKIATAGGATSGIDLALHVVTKYYGDEVAQVTADILGHRSNLWKNPQYEQVEPVAASK